MPVPSPRDQWYVVHVLSGQEGKVRDNMNKRIVTEEMGDCVYEVLVPTERVSEVKKGKEDRNANASSFPATSSST